MNKNWINPDEAIEGIMKHLGCSRRTARRKLAENIKAKKVRTRRVPVEAHSMPPAEVLQKLDAGKQHEVLIGLDDFMKHFGLTWKETLVELQAGRLIAGADETTMLMQELNEAVPINRYTVSVEAVEEWLANPETPNHLIGRPHPQ